MELGNSTASIMSIWYCLSPQFTKFKGNRTDKTITYFFCLTAAMKYHDFTFDYLQTVKVLN